eukprot:GFKZ01005659.1.p1 GENE.GFKZ01005659.1~~GFKZ01005659.1.p1  ORF type:complete len:377 (-),score=56.00 GFKZ01005659.1:213-1343(-)
MSKLAFLFVPSLLSAIFLVSAGAAVQPRAGIFFQIHPHSVRTRLSTKSTPRRSTLLSFVKSQRPISVHVTNRRSHALSQIHKFRSYSHSRVSVHDSKGTGNALQQLQRFRGAKVPSTLRMGLTLDPCSTDDDCQGSRVCGLDGELCNGQSGCQCIPTTDPTCESDADCVDGESCAEGDDESFCVSDEFLESSAESVVNNESDESSSNDSSGTDDDDDDSNNGEDVDGGDSEGDDDDEEEDNPSSDSDTPSIIVGEGTGDQEDEPSAVCIDVEALSHLSADDLVFSSHSLSSVLCDEFGSCATRGHIVTYRGKAMMMATYCKLVECERKKILVNSPRYKMGRRISSKTKDLEYTAFAARYETRVEEKFLKTAVHLGL